MKEIHQLTWPYGLYMPTHDCMGYVTAALSPHPRSHLSQHTHSQEIYDPLKQSHSLTSVAWSALLQERWVRDSCHHTPAEESSRYHTFLQQGHACPKMCHPALGAEQRSTQGRARSLQLKCLHHIACRLLQTLGFSQESPFLCLHAVLWDLRHKTAQGLRLKMQETTKLKVELPTRFLSKICLLHSHSFQVTKTKSIVPVDYHHCHAYYPHRCLKSAGLIPLSKTPLLSNSLTLMGLSHEDHSRSWAWGTCTWGTCMSLYMMKTHAEAVDSEWLF